MYGFANSFPDCIINKKKNSDLFQNINLHVAAPPLITFIQGVHEQVDAVAYDSTARVPCDGHAVAGNIQLGVIRNLTGIYRYDTPFGPQSNGSRPGCAAAPGISRCFTVNYFFKIMQSGKEFAKPYTMFCSCLFLT